MAGHDRITPEGRRFLEQIEKLKQLEVRVGFQDDGTMAARRTEDGIEDAEVSLLEIAIWNELGTYNSPSRPFLRQSVDDNDATIKTFCKAQMQMLAQGKTAEEVLNSIGVMQKGLVQDKIKSGTFEPNAEITIHGGWMKNKKSGKLFFVQGKKSEKPLVATGHMRESVSYVIKEKEG